MSEFKTEKGQGMTDGGENDKEGICALWLTLKVSRHFKGTSLMCRSTTLSVTFSHSQ